MKTGGNRRLPGSYERKEHCSRRVNKIQWGVEKERCNLKIEEDTGDSQVQIREEHDNRKSKQDTSSGKKMLWKGNNHQWLESIATLPPFSPIEGHKWFFQISANDSLRKTSLHLSLLAKSSLSLCIWDLPFNAVLPVEDRRFVVLVHMWYILCTMYCTCYRGPSVRIFRSHFLHWVNPSG